MKIIPVILSGGSGTRLWPVSRKYHPKQFLSLIGGKSMFQETILRLDGLENLLSPIIVCNSDHRFLAAEQLKQIGISDATILLEPIGRNTAPAIASAAIQARKTAGNVLMLVLSADHLILDIDAFHNAIRIAADHAQEEKLITFGIFPDKPKTGYGYIKLSNNNINGSFKVEAFVEKPSKKVAEKMLQDGGFLWNSGMFVFKTETLLNEMKLHSNEILTNIQESLDNTIKDLDFIRLGSNGYNSCPSDSIDYALMEKSNNVLVIPIDAGWSDIGSWSALYENSESDDNGNVIKGDVILKDTLDTYIDAKHHMVATIGIENMVIIDTPDVTFIAKKDKAHEVKILAEKLNSQGRDEALNHRKVYRPWGWYDCIEIGENFQVKRLHVSPGAKLSLQMHYKRAEHWIVVTGEASVVNGDKEFVLKEGESTFIPIGISHSLENATTNHLEIIEIQTGSYLGEDDIVRFEDIYGRLDNQESH